MSSSGSVKYTLQNMILTRPANSSLSQEGSEKCWGKKVVCVHHVGSTAVINQIAKPIIDLLVEVADLEPIASMTDSFIEAGHKVRGESGIPGRRFLTWNKDWLRTYDIHIFQTGNDEIVHILLFRDRLRENPDVSTSYADLRRELAAKFHDDVLRYTQEKSEFILGAVVAQRRVVAARSDWISCSSWLWQYNISPEITGEPTRFAFKAAWPDSIVFH